MSLTRGQRSTLTRIQSPSEWPLRYSGYICMLRRDIPGTKYSAYTCDWPSRADAVKDGESFRYFHYRKGAGVSRQSPQWQPRSTGAQQRLMIGVDRYGKRGTGGLNW